MSAEKTSDVGALVRWAWHNMSGFRASILASCVCGVLRVILSLIFVWVSKMLVDIAVSPDGEPGTMILLSLVLVALMIVEVALNLIAQYLTKHTEIKLKNRMRLRLFDQVLVSRWVEHQDIHSGDMISRLTEDLRQFCDVATTRFQQVVVMVSQFAGAFILFCILSWKLALIIVGIMPLCILLSKIYVRKTRKLTADMREAESEIQVGMQEGIQHHLVVQTLGAKDSVHNRVDQSQSWLYGKTVDRLRFSVFSRGMMSVGFMGCFITAFLWSVWHLHSGTITFGTMTAFLQLVGRLQNPVVNISMQIPTIVQSLASIDRLMEIEALPAEHQGKPKLLDSPVGIRLQNVTFGYPRSERLVFSDYSHDFVPGSKTVLMGVTGVGKSTLIKLVLGLLSPQSGRVLLYDSKGETVAGADTRCNMTYVPQGNSLLDGTIRENLLLVAPDATDNELREALHIAVADFVYDLPGGLDTKCGELGNSLSEGQAQRIAIARGLLRKGGIMLLDEFNSSLDYATASTLISRLLAARPSETIIFISHRPEVIAHCDYVIELVQK